MWMPKKRNTLPSSPFMRSVAECSPGFRFGSCGSACGSYREKLAFALGWHCWHVVSRRSADTIGLCAEEAIRIEGKQVPLDGSELGAGKIAMMLRFPAGVVGAIVPFNAPFNMACHKVGPALAAGNAVPVAAGTKSGAGQPTGASGAGCGRWRRRRRPRSRGRRA